jgi:hypothetical protein
MKSRHKRQINGHSRRKSFTGFVAADLHDRVIARQMIGFLAGKLTRLCICLKNLNDGS